MISFEYVQNNGTPVIGYQQTHCAEQLKACKNLAKAKDATGGLAGKAAAKGISCIPLLPPSTRDVIFVVDHVFVRTSLKSVHEECDFMLNGAFYRMISGQKPQMGHKTWEDYPPEAIVKIALPRSMANINKKPLAQQAQPAPMNQVAPPSGGPGQTAPTGFYATVTQTTPTDTYASMGQVMPKLGHYADMSQLMPVESSYVTV